MISHLNNIKEDISYRLEREKSRILAIKLNDQRLISALPFGLNTYSNE